MKLILPALQKFLLATEKNIWSAYPPN